MLRRSEGIVTVKLLSVGLEEKDSDIHTLAYIKRSTLAAFYISYIW